jgi:hypothetical protein
MALATEASFLRAFSSNRPFSAAVLALEEMRFENWTFVQKFHSKKRHGKGKTSVKRSVVLLLFLGMTVFSEAQVNVVSKAVDSPEQPRGILQSVENGDIASAGDHYLVTRKDNRLPVKMVFKSSQGVGMNRESGQWWVLPLSAAGSQVSVNTNLWVLPVDPFSRENSWNIKLRSGGSISARLDAVLNANIDASEFELYKSEARPHSDSFNHRYSFNVEGGAVLENTLAAFYWGTILPSVVEKTTAKNYPYSDGYVVSTLSTGSYAGSYPDVDHEFQIKGRLAVGSDLDLDVVRRMIELQFKLMNDDPEGLFRIPCSVQPSGVREYHVRRNSLDNKENAEMFLLTGNIEVLEESWRYYEATKDNAWLLKNLTNLENAASETIANTDQYGRVWSDVYYEDQVIEDGRVTQAGAFAAYTFGLLAKIEGILNREDKSTYYSALSKKIASALVQPLPMGYWDEKNQRFVDWVDRNGRVHDHIHLLANALPVVFGYASDAQANSVQHMIDANIAAFQRFPSFLAVDIAGYDKSEIGSGGPYDLSAAGRYWFWDATYWESRGDKKRLFSQLDAVATQAAKQDYFMGERYDMDYVYYIDGKNWHGAEKYYEYPCVYASVLIAKYLGITNSVDADVSVSPRIQGYGTVEYRIPRYDLKYAYNAGGFTLKNLSDKKRRFKVDLSALYEGKTQFKLATHSGSQTVGPMSVIELSSQEEASLIPVK